MMSDTVAVSKVVITIGKKEIPLSLDEAKELQEILNKTFGKVVEHHHHDHWRNWPYTPYGWQNASEPRYKSSLGGGTIPGAIPTSYDPSSSMQMQNWSVCSRGDTMHLTAKSA